MEKRTSHLEFTSQLNEKNTVILEIGTRYTRCGFAGEPSPRAIIRSCVSQNGEQPIYLYDIQDNNLLEEKLRDFIEMIYFNNLAVTPKEKKVVIVESVFSRTAFRDAITRVLFDRFNVPSLLFVPDHLMALASLGLSSGIVVDIGSLESKAIAVVEGVTLLDGAHVTTLAAKSLDTIIRSQLNKNEPDFENSLNDIVLEDIRIKTCFVAPYERAAKKNEEKIDKLRLLHKKALEDPESEDLEYSLNSMLENHNLMEMDQNSPPSVKYCLDGSTRIDIPGNLREGVCEMFFEMLGHEHSIPSMIIETILMAPIDCRRLLSENIVLIGGLTNLPGFLHRLSEELINIHNNYPKILGKVPEKFKFHDNMCPSNYVSWLGASMFCSNSFLEMRSETREKWLKGGKKSPNDWCDLLWHDKFRINNNILESG